MKKIAILSDIHGNAPALEAALDDLRRQDADEVLLGGDLVGRGPEGNKVVERLRQLGWRGVRGNHEDYLLGFRRGEVHETWLHDDEWAASRWMAAELTEASIRYIDSLPLSITANAAPGICLVHGSPRSYSEGLGVWSSDEELERHLDSIDGSTLVCGHTHRSMRRELRGGCVINVGAVGLPFNRDQRAQYAILHCEDGNRRIEFRRVPYDVGLVLEIYRTTGFLEHGGVTARLLKLEVEHAAPFLVPFTRWAKARRFRIESSRIEAFLDFYDPDEPIPEFLARLKRLS